MTWIARCYQRCLRWFAGWRRPPEFEASIPSPLEQRVRITSRPDARITGNMVLAPELPPGLHKAAWLLSECRHDEHVPPRGGLADGTARRS